MLKEFTEKNLHGRPAATLSAGRAEVRSTNSIFPDTFRHFRSNRAMRFPSTGWLENADGKSGPPRC